MPKHHSNWIRRAATVLALLTVAAGAVPSRADNTATTPVSRADKRWLACHEAMNQRVKQGNVDLLFIGDSIVQNWDRQGTPVWEFFYGSRHAVNLGISGDRTEHVLWRLDHGNLEGIKPKLAIVMIGQNNGPRNTAEEIAEGVTAIVRKLREKLPETRILLLAIFFRGEQPNSEQTKLAKTNTILAKLADDKTVFYMNINKIFLRPDGTILGKLMPDFEHPNEEGYRLWAEAIEPKVVELMGETAAKP